VDARGAVVVADTRERAVEQADRLFVLVQRARGFGGAPEAGRALARLTCEREWRAISSCAAARGPRVQLEPARDDRVIDAALALVEVLVDELPQVRIREPQLALARHDDCAASTSHSRSTSFWIAAITAIRL